MNLEDIAETKQELINFEEEIREAYESGKIRAPVHLCRGNEEPLIKIFKNIKKEDWVFSTHRSHYHALLKGIPKEWVRDEILNKRSISLNNSDYNFFSSAIVGGSLPIAVGTAYALKLEGSLNHVWAFVGDMAAEMGVFEECTKYSGRNELPITFIVEDNGLSVNTPTQKAWGDCKNGKANIIRYSYERVYPHHGSGRFVQF